MAAIRTWKSDGSTNAMDLSAAVLNLVSNADPAYEGETADDKATRLRKALIRGHTVETPLATFRMERA